MLITKLCASDLPQKIGYRTYWQKLHGSSSSLAIVIAAQQHDKPTIVITPNSETASRLAQACQFYRDEQIELPILNFPDWETLPYDQFSVHQDIISERLHHLYTISHAKRYLLIIPITTLMHRLPPTDYVNKHSLMLTVGQQFNPTDMRQQLENVGYRCVNTVFEHGEFAIRGAIMDIFPMGSTTPYRIDLFDDEIETLRIFDPETQRSINQVDKIQLLPAKEFPIDEAAISHFRQAWRELFDVDNQRCPTYQDISAGITPPGIEYYLPLFFPHLSSLFDYLPDNTLVFTVDNLATSADHFWQDINHRYDERRYDIEHPIVAPQQLFIPTNELFGQFKQFALIQLDTADHSQATNIAFDTETPKTLTIDATSKEPLKQLNAYIQQAIENKYRILFCAESAGRREVLLELLSRINIQPELISHWPAFTTSKTPLAITVAQLDDGLCLPEEKLIVIVENQLFGQQVLQQRRRKKQQDSSDQVIKNLTELNIGAPIVHTDHGIGRYLGLQTITIDDQPTEFLTLEYADEAKLYVPVASLHLINRYLGADSESAPLHRLGTDQWQKAKRKAAEKVRDTAAELLAIYAKREAEKGISFSIPVEDYNQFANGFPFEETPDQENAIQAVINDMSSTQPMDRLICGDVGFGKTEVAMRAAFIAIQNHKQVAILVPTTLLAQQHYQSFCDRFADWPINIDVVSRFRTQKEQNSIYEQLKNGKVDIVIGTHKLIQQNINFNNLGLLIIDEEHRFGVKQKETLKSLRTHVDILTLTATPIPRTLNMAMSGMRDLSIIATPPARRLSIKTFVCEQKNSIIKEAIARELLRGGQVYYLHNEIDSISKTMAKLNELIPEARVMIAHGQMHERDLERAMSDFYHKRYNILVSTTIIETGIDIPNANTIIIDRADKFGLAQLHQLRGRVGRSHHQAYAYLFTPHPKLMTKDAHKRLEAIEQAEDLGAGFTLATHDLEIRGAGELLGDEQSGQIHTIGFSLYTEMLEQAVDSIKNGYEFDYNSPTSTSTEINLHLPALIPDDYLPDVHSRLILYKRIANANNSDELQDLQVEMIDRFGLLPNPIKNLFSVTDIKLQAQSMGLSKLNIGPKQGHVEFSSTTKVAPTTIIQLIQTQPAIFKLQGSTKLAFRLNLEKPEKRLDYGYQILDLLNQN